MVTIELPIFGSNKNEKIGEKNISKNYRKRVVVSELIIPT